MVIIHRIAINAFPKIGSRPKFCFRLAPNPDTITVAERKVNTIRKPSKHLPNTRFVYLEVGFELLLQAKL